ncbi:MAG: hypothetical protein Q8P72_02885, partial [Candidatus Roizmanbacteria bacterium]|nr:hypothetical protein [Candidatus Roizmanbacteria bacterium]
MNTIPSATKKFTTLYRSMLKSTGEFAIDQILDGYKNMKPSLHKYADTDQIDIEAFMYAFLRLPKIIHEAQVVVVAQIAESFRREGHDLDVWEEVDAPARRRKMYFNGEKMLAAYINSVTDLDDMVGLLTAFSIEWNKIHHKLQDFDQELTNANAHEIQELIGVDTDNWKRLNRIWDVETMERLSLIKSKRMNFSIKLIRGHYVDYKKAAQRWFEYIVEHTQHKDLRNRPVYFISSNTHSIVNNLTGWVTQIEPELISYIETHKTKKFIAYWKQIEKGEHDGSRENFLWYILKKYEVDHPEVRKKREAYEKEMGIDFIEAKYYLDIDAQVFPLRAILNSSLAGKLQHDLSYLEQSDALVLNIDYPLGSGAYMVLSTILHNLNNPKGVYILGKASFLKGNLGDIGLPTQIFDTYTNNTYKLGNAFTKDYFKMFKSGDIVETQKVVSTKGTLPHPADVINQYFENGYTIIEMEDGPYLN